MLVILIRFAAHIQFVIRNTVMPMDRIFTPRIILFLVFASVMTFAGCNVKGFFVEPGDDPEWVDPDAAKNAQAAGDAGAGAGGPGAAVFSKICAGCHQGSGKGVPGTYPPLAGSQLAIGDPIKPIKVILHGFKGKIVRNGTSYEGLMAPWKDNLSDQEIADVLNYVRKSWGNSAADEVTADMVKQVRDETATRSTGWTESEL